MATRYTAIDNKKYVICYDLSKQILHYKILEEGDSILTGQPVLEAFDIEGEVIQRIKELGFNPYNYIIKFEFLSYATEEECLSDIDKINTCLGLDYDYISKPIMMYDKSDDSFLSYIILTDFRVKECLTPEGINKIMYSTDTQVKLV
jgi:hypothetical protein